MKITVCDICGKSLNDDNKAFLPEVVGDVWGRDDGIKPVFGLQEADICQHCQEQIFDFIEVLRKNAREGENNENSSL